MSDRVIDWEAIERDYRAGLLSVREIAANHGITHGAINKRAKRDGWDRDLSARIQAKADALVSKRAVSAAVSAEKLATERQIVEASAEAIVRVRLEHRSDIAGARNLARQLLAELSAQTDQPDLIAALRNALESDVSREAVTVFERVSSLAGRAKTLKDLADTLKTLVALEREAYGLSIEGAGLGAPPGLSHFYGGQ